MIKEKSQRQALKIMIGLLTTVTLFHILIVTQIVPFTIVWAGKLQNVEEMRVFETISILINLFLLFILLLKGDYLNYKISDKILNWILWLFMVAFALNTIGNLMSKTLFEKILFTPLTLISAVLIWTIIPTKRK